MMIAKGSMMLGVALFSALLAQGTPGPDAPITIPFDPNTPTLDGEVHPDEWGGAAKVDVTLYDERTGKGFLARLWLKHDGTNLCFALVVLAPLGAGSVWVEFYFDKDGDGKRSDGDDGVLGPAKTHKKVPKSSRATDLYYDAKRKAWVEDTKGGGERHVVGAGREERAGQSAIYAVEVCHPLDSGDPRDIAWKVDPQQRKAINVRVFLQPPAPIPSDVLRWRKDDQWHQVVLEPPHTSA